MTATLNSFII